MYNDLELGEYDYRQFIKRIRTVVMGRGTYDFLEKDGSPWAYGEQRVLVVTSRPIAAPKGQLERRSDVDDLIRELRGLSDGDVWILGGGKLQMAFIERCALDEIEIYVMPELIGGGRPLFPPDGVRRLCACSRSARSTKAVSAFITPSTALRRAKLPHRRA